MVARTITWGEFRRSLRLVAMVVAFLYVSYISIFVLNTTFEMFLFEFFCIVLLFWSGRRSEFIKDWIGFVALFVVYEFLRGIVDDIAPFKAATYYYIYLVEEFIFPTLPTKYLQDTLAGFTLINNISFIAYLSFFYYSFLVGFFVWVKDKKLFRSYTRNFLLLSYTGLAIFFLLPTAPPWYVDANFAHLNIQRLIFDGSLFANLRGLSLYRYFVGGNEVAALPSLHVAWVAYTSLFVVRYSKHKFKYIFLALPVLVGFSVIINAEHWLIDVLLGFVLAYIFTRQPLKPLKERDLGYNIGIPFGASTHTL